MKFKILLNGLLLAAVLTATGCNKDNSGTDTEMATRTGADYQMMIAGSNSKTWHADKQMNAEGDKEKLSRTERKDDMMIFNADGTFSMNTSQDAAGGKWTYDQAAQTLSLQFSGENHTETFKVLNLEDDEMKLEAADGSTMELEAEG